MMSIRTRFLLLFSMIMIASADTVDNNCNEPIEYINFLKVKLNQELELMLQKEFMKADPSEFSQTNLRLIEGSMMIRNSLLERLLMIGKEEIKICDVRVDQKSKLETFRGLLEDLLLRLVSNASNQVSQLRAISEDLLSLRRKISSEIMRVVMLPEMEADNLSHLGSGCEYCEGLEDVAWRLQNLITCAQKPDSFTEDNFANIFGRISGNTVMPGDFCSTSVSSYEEEVGHIIEDLEKEVRRDYQLLLSSTDETSASKYRAVLLLYSEARSDLDTVHIKLASDQDEKHQKRTIVNGLAGITNKLTGSTNDCMEMCAPTTCDSCAVTLLTEITELLLGFNSVLEQTSELGQDNIEHLVEAQRGDMIQVMGKLNEEARKVLRAKTKGETISECSQKKTQTWEKLKNPLWLLVNTTIQAGPGEVMLTNSAMVDILGLMRREECSPDTMAQPLTMANCRNTEYETLKDAEAETDQIQSMLFHVGDEDTRLDVILALIDLNELLDVRIQDLFEEGYQCPAEIDFIKFNLMPTLSTCLAYFINLNADLRSISRQDRLSCIKQMGNKIEQRKLLLLRDEVNHNLQLINNPESSTIPVINIRTTTPTTTTTEAYRPIVNPTPPRPTQAPSKLTQACPDSCIKAAKLGSCLAGCEQYIGIPSCCVPECPHKCRRFEGENDLGSDSCTGQPVRECHFIPGCCPQQFTEIYGEGIVAFATQNLRSVPRK